LAVIVVFSFIVNMHCPFPSHPPPDQPANIEPFLGVASSVISVPVLYALLHLRPQFIPASEEVTFPLPLLFTLRVYLARLASFEY
jgi:hypothetical protein